MQRILSAIAMLVISGAMTYALFLTGSINATLAGATSGGDRVVFVGRAFQINQGILSDFDRARFAGYDAFPPPISGSFLSQDGPDHARVANKFEEYRPHVVVLQALPDPDQPLGWQRKMVRNMTRIAGLAQEHGADVVIVAHPPPPPDASVGYLAKMRQVERAAEEAAAASGARLARVGAFFAEVPHPERLDLYSSRGRVFSAAGDLAVALSIGAALGATPTADPSRLSVTLPKGQSMSAWIERAQSLSAPAAGL